MEPIVQLPQVEETPVIEPAVVVESGPVEFAKEGKSRDFSRDFLVMLCNHDVFSDEIHEEDDDYFHDDDDDVNELPVEDHGSNAPLSVFHLVFLLLHVMLLQVMTITRISTTMTTGTELLTSHSRNQLSSVVLHLNFAIVL